MAIDLAKQGFDVDACGCLGSDTSAEVLLQSLTQAGVDCGQIQRLESQATSKTVILLIEGEDRRYIHTFVANAAFNVQQISRQWIDGLKVFYLGGLFAMPGIETKELAELLRYCRQRGIVTVVDVVVSQHYSGMDALLPLLPHIDYSHEKMELSRRRMEARNNFRYIDRVPVLYGLFARYFAPLFNLRYIDFFKDAETHYHWQLQFAKYRIENIPEDYCTGHSRRDACHYQPKSEREEWAAKDPIDRFADVLKAQGIADDESLKTIKTRILQQFDEAVENAKRAPQPSLQDLTTDVFS